MRYNETEEVHFSFIILAFDNFSIQYYHNIKLILNHTFLQS